MTSIKTGLRKILVNSFFAHMRRSYSQSGEDIIVSYLFERMGIKKPTYLDIGANHPIALSNTYRLYTLGCRGVLIEPNPFLYKKLLQKRKGDKCINIGIAFDENTEADFYIFPEKYHGLNTFSKKEADFWTNTGNEEISKQNIEKIIRIPLVNINEIMGEYFTPYPNFVSIDVEGLDLQIVKTIDFEKFQPEVFCIETFEFIEHNMETKNKEIIYFFESNGYFVYADTYVNTIFCRKDAHKKFV